MNDERPCRLCGAFGVKLSTDGHQVCPGCGVTSLRDIVLYQRQKHTLIDIDILLRKYRTSQTSFSFGTFMVMRNFELGARP